MIALSPGHLYVSHGTLPYIKVCDGHLVKLEAKNVDSEQAHRCWDSNWSSVHKQFDDTTLDLNHQQSSEYRRDGQIRATYVGGYQSVQSKGVLYRDQHWEGWKP